MRNALREAYPEVILKAWTYFEALRKLGYPSEMIYFSPSEGSVQMALKDGDRQVVMVAGPIDCTLDELVDLWTAFVDDLRDAPQSELTEIWESDLNMVLGRSVDFLGALMSNGFHEWKHRKDQLYS